MHTRHHMRTGDLTQKSKSCPAECRQAPQNAVRILRTCAKGAGAVAQRGHCGSASQDERFRDCWAKPHTDSPTGPVPPLFTAGRIPSAARHPDISRCRRDHRSSRSSSARRSARRSAQSKPPRRRPTARCWQRSRPSRAGRWCSGGRWDRERRGHPARPRRPTARGTWWEAPGWAAPSRQWSPHGRSTAKAGRPEGDPTLREPAAL
mmetsp:Transcript_35661/g.98667  ORF Transcript_35661/g.98667 Transcript_35661/m.98667 type:complete len:206 (+) Transcript_35661:72-689(+)